MPLRDWLFVLPWLLPWIVLIRLARRRPDLAGAEPGTGAPLSIVIPARNERETIATVLGSVRDSRYRPLEVLVVDDRSDDGTGDLVRTLAAGDPLIRLVDGEPLPSGWYGKPWACLQGYRRARSDLILFTDADTTHGPELHARAVAMMQRLGADLFTVMPRQRCDSFWERVVMPQFWMLLGVRYHPASVNRARRRRDIIANGQFILVHRAAYEQAGTHAAVRGEVAEDLALAQAFFDAGLKVRFAFAESYMETRMYRSLAHMVEGWSKNIFLGGRRSYPDEPVRRALVPVALAAGLGFWLVPSAAVLGAGAGLVPGLGAPAMAAFAAASGFWAMVSRSMRIPAWYGVLHPLGALVALYIVGRSAWRGGTRVEWRGRVYGPAGAHDQDQGGG
jgi:cellulose synthase/poly-beta-1,6-N-acetylglucosamine synthase-like glycosyltransferase